MITDSKVEKDCAWGQAQDKYQTFFCASFFSQSFVPSTVYIWYWCCATIEKPHRQWIFPFFKRWERQRVCKDERGMERKWSSLIVECESYKEENPSFSIFHAISYLASMLALLKAKILPMASPRLKSNSEDCQSIGHSLPYPLKQTAFCTGEKKKDFQDFLLKHRHVSKLPCFSYIQVSCVYLLFVFWIKAYSVFYSRYRPLISTYI